MQETHVTVKGLERENTPITFHSYVQGSVEYITHMQVIISYP